MVSVGTSLGPIISAALPVTSVTSRTARRRTALVIAMILSGGLLFFPRLPLLAVLLVLCFIDRGATLTISRRMLPGWLWLAAVLALTLVRPGVVDIGSTAVRFANFAGAMALLRMYLEAPEGALANDLRAILPWMSWQAILTVPFGHLLGTLALSTTFDDATYHSFLLIFTWHDSLIGDSPIIRPDGLFWEPGVFQIYLNLHLLTALFWRRNWTQAGLAITAIIATQSTTGLLIAGVQLLAVAWPVLSRGDILQRTVKFAGLLAILLPFAALTVANVTDKFFGEARGSAWARQYDLITGLNIVSQYPLGGIGFDHKRYQALGGVFGFDDTELSVESLEDRGSSNGIVQVFYSIGIPLGFFFIFGLFRNLFLRPRWLVGTILTLAMIGEALAYTPIFSMFALSGMCLPFDRINAKNREK
jgi:hypothetical protein